MTFRRLSQYSLVAANEQLGDGVRADARAWILTAAVAAALTIPVTVSSNPVRRHPAAANGRPSWATWEIATPP